MASMQALNGRYTPEGWQISRKVGSEWESGEVFPSEEAAIEASGKTEWINPGAAIISRDFQVRIEPWISEERLKALREKEAAAKARMDAYCATQDHTMKPDPETFEQLCDRMSRVPGW